MKKEENIDTNYKIEEDPRFKVCFKEAIMCYVFYFAFFVIVMLTTYKLGNQFVLGLPLWFLVGAIIVPVIFIGILIFLIENVFEDTDLDPYI